jgi:serine/threonine-protein kinase
MNPFRAVRGSAAPAVVAALLATTSPARANDPATATMLFEQGRQLAAAGRYGEACPKFEESQRLDPGIGTQFHLADCYEHTGRVASAWALFLDVASTAGGTGQEARENLARKRATALEPKLSKLTVAVPQAAPGLEVHRNGEALAAVLWSSAVPVDAGSYTVEATAPGRKRWSTVAAVGPDGASVTVTVPPLEAEAPAPGPTASVAAAHEAPPGDAAQRARIEQIAAYGLTGGAGLGVALGIGFGLASISKHGDYEKYCSGNVCAAPAQPLHDAAVSAGNASTVSFVVGTALAAGAGVAWYLYLSGKNSPPVTVAPAVGVSSGGATVAGAW